MSLFISPRHRDPTPETHLDTFITHTPSYLTSSLRVIDFLLFSALSIIQSHLRLCFPQALTLSAPVQTGETPK